MQCRQFGREDWPVSALGLGIPQTPRLFDEHQFVEAVRWAIDHGVNYLDLGYPRHLGQDEALRRAVGRALAGGYRERVRIAVNLPVLLISSLPDIGRYLEEQLRSFPVGRFDFFLLGGLNRLNWPVLQSIGALDWAAGALADGRIGRLGFSFHDEYLYLKEVLEAYPDWSVCQFQYSFVDNTHHPGISGLKYTAGQGLAVVITEPLRGGRLTGNLPGPVAAVWSDAQTKRSLNNWGMRWVWSHPDVTTVVSEISTLDEMKENIALVEAGGAEPGNLSLGELVLVSRVADAYRGLRPVRCEACRCCMPCPAGIDAPRIIEHYNDAAIYGDVRTSSYNYRFEGHDPGACTECGRCMQACPRRLPIVEILKAARRLFEDGGTIPPGNQDR